MIKISPTWQNQSKKWGHPLHSICSYLAMFPPRLPHYFIDRFTQRGDIVLDPFSGRGTAPAQACFADRIGVGNDLNPLAYILTKAKVELPEPGRLKERSVELEENFESQEIEQIPDEIKMLFSTNTLRQLIYLRDTLDFRKRTDVFIMAIILGGLHGSSPLPSYMSIPMPNTFSMAPNYVKNYITKHGLRPPDHDAFDVINYRMKRIYSHGMPGTPGKAYNGDIRNLSKKLNGIKAKLILTSPPYLKVVKYGKYNWIRLWMLGEDPKKIDNGLDATHTLRGYLDFMRDSLNEMYAVLEDNGLCVLVIGDVQGRRGIGERKKLNLAQKVWNELKDEISFELISIVVDRYKNRNKVSRIWGRTKGMATERDRLLVLCKDKSKVRAYKDRVNWNPVYMDRFSKRILLNN